MITEKIDHTCIGVDHQAQDTTTSHFSFALHNKMNNIKDKYCSKFFCNLLRLTNCD